MEAISAFVQKVKNFTQTVLLARLSISVLRTMVDVLISVISTLVLSSVPVQVDSSWLQMGNLAWMSMNVLIIQEGDAM